MEGGESVFLDSFHVAEEFRKQFPEQFENLVRIPETFKKIHFERYTLICFSLTQDPILWGWLCISSLPRTRFVARRLIPLSSPSFGRKFANILFVSFFFSRDYPVKLVYKRPHIVLNPDKEVQ